MDIQQTGVNMRRLKSGSVIFAMAAMLAGCMVELGDEWASEPGADDESSIPDDEKEPVVDKTYLGDLGVALGSPVATGHTGGLSNEYQPTCVGNSVAPEATYTWTAPSTGSFVFDTMGSGFDTVLEIRRYSDNLSLGCNDDSSGLQSRVTVSLSAGQTVLVVIDGYGSSTGTYRLNIAGGGPAPGCGSPTSQVPTMTGSASPTGVVSRSGVYSSAYEAWQAFDGSNTSMWISQVWQAPAWIAYQWADGPRIITRYSIAFVNGSLTSRAPREWTLQGWNGNSWVVVDTRTAQTNWAGTETRTYDVISPGFYSQYRLHITEDNDARAAIVVVSMGRLDLMGCR
jgi:hypothetical protein